MKKQTKKTTDLKKIHLILEVELEQEARCLNFTNLALREVSHPWDVVLSAQWVLEEAG